MSAGNIYDIIGIGVGPANLSLAVALYEEKVKRKYLFLEKKASFSWHEGMMLPDSTITTPFTKDLVTLYNPMSYFSFLNFLKEEKIMHDFIALNDLFPTRNVFDQYFKWAAKKLGNHIFYAHEVKDIIPFVQSNSKKINLLKVIVSSNGKGENEVFLTKNVVLGVGLQPRIPIKVKMSNTLFHANNFMYNIKKVKNNHNYSFIVVGAGQSAVEILNYLLSNFEKSQISVLSRGLIFNAVDNNPFVNELYTYCNSRLFFELNAQAKDIVEAYTSLSNYSAGDSEIIKSIAQKSYDRKVNGGFPLKIFPFSEIKSIQKKEAHHLITYQDRLNQELQVIQADIICFATGYEEKHPLPILNSMHPHLKFHMNEYDLNENYQIKHAPELTAGIYLQGLSEKTHGLIERTIADLPERSHAILKAIKKRLNNKKL